MSDSHDNTLVSLTIFFILLYIIIPLQLKVDVQFKFDLESEPGRQQKESRSRLGVPVELLQLPGGCGGETDGVTVLCGASTCDDAAAGVFLAW
jgi:hypothetical protein